MSLDRAQRLQNFVDWSAQHITGDEKGQAQIFLDRLLQAFGQPGLLEVGGTPEFRIKKGKDEEGGTSFADYVWKPRLLVEMKKRGVDLARTRQQAFEYWIKLVPNRPQYTVLCNFDEFWIYDFNIDLDEPLDKLALADLPKRYDPLAFLFPTQERPIFQNNRVEVTRQAADRLATVFNEITTRTGDRFLAQRFALQALVALFAEDIGLLPRHFFTSLLADIKSPEDSAELIGGLFEAMNRPHSVLGRYKTIQYFNGGLFEQPARVELSDTELASLREAAKQDWSKVSPDIFGTLFQHSMDQPERHAFGAHYTAPIDIMKIVNPTIVEPWTQLIATAKKPKQLADLLERLSMYTVLDPACGSGNFLYLAYRELKRLETKIRDRLLTEFPEFQAPIYHVTARQFHGMDILPFAIELAKVTMMLARKLAIDELHIADEPPLPLDNLDTNFLCGDALMTEPKPTVFNGAGQTDAQSDQPRSKPFATAWPPADIIIGNPPFLGAKRLKPERGPDYVNSLRDLYPEVPGMADYCVYWFRRAHDHLPICTPDRPERGRAGLVGTQNIRNNQSRVGGLDHIVKSGTIVEAVENQPWSGEANVHVSIANWVKVAGKVAGTLRVPSPSGTVPTPDPAKLLIPAKKKLWFKVDPKLALFSQDFSQDKKNRATPVMTKGKSGKTLVSKSYELDFRETQIINPALSDQTDVTQATVLECNTNPQRAFIGQMLGHEGFLLTARQAEELVKSDRASYDVLYPYLNGKEFLTGNGIPERSVLDFGQRDQLQAAAYKTAFAWVQRHVLPDREKNAKKGVDKDGNLRSHHKAFLAHWWQLSFARGDLISWIESHSRFVACSRVTKRPVFVFVSSRVRPGDALACFAFEDDYSFGILQSSAHWKWFATKSSKLTERLRYSPESVFDTFPWPQSPTKKQIEAVAAAGREIRHIRTEALQKMTGGLRALYRTLELPGQNPLKTAHATLDTAVLEAYGFDPNSDLLTQLLTLNFQLAADIESGTPVTAPGIPPSYGDAKSLITDDCINP